VRDQEFAEKVGSHQKAMGVVPGPFDCFLTHRGIKSLAVRMDRHCVNAERVAAFLTSHPKVGTVIYPGLETHSGHEGAQRQMKRSGGL
ncbi:cystathionine gamma-synthase, partial [Nocardioides humilatus]